MGRHTAAMLTIAATQMWLVSTVPVHVLAHADYDDALFARLAISLLNGEWLGGYDSLTLIKGPVYPMWLAAVAWLGLPLLLAQDALYLLAGGLLLRLLRLRWAGVMIFAAYALNPLLTSTGQLRVIREGLYTPLVVLLMALVVWWWCWRERSLRLRLLPAVALGAVLSLLWMTREEGPWLLPPLALGALLCLGTPLLKRLLHDGALVGLAALIAWGGTQAVALINKAHYGVTEVVAFREPAFIAAYSALSRIEHDAWRSLIPVPREVVRRGAKHSPALADLAPYLDGPMADGWAAEGCQHYGETPCHGEVYGGWFIWALRGATVLAGHHSTATEARDFYRQLADEIDIACADGRLACSAPRHTFVPPHRVEYLFLAGERALEGARRLVTFSDAGLTPVESTGRVLDYSLIADLIGGPTFPRSRTVWLRGSVLSTQNRIAAVESLGTSDGWQQVELTNRRRFTDGTQWVDFDVQTSCVTPDCRLRVIGEYGVLGALRFDEIAERVKLGAVTVLFADLIDSRDRLAPRDPRRDLIFAIVNANAQAWRTVGGVAAGLALVAFVVALSLAVRWRHLSGEIMLCLVLLTGIIVRLALLAYMDATALPAINALYMSPIVPLWILFLGLAPLALRRAWQER